MSSNQFLSINQANKFGEAFKDTILSAFPDLRPNITTNGQHASLFGPVRVNNVTVRTDNKLIFKIEDVQRTKFTFGVNPVIVGNIEGNKVIVKIHWEVEIADLLIQDDGTNFSVEIRQNYQKPPRIILEDILEEKNSTITSLISDPQICGLEEYGKAKNMIQHYLDEFSAIVFMDMILETYG